MFGLMKNNNYLSNYNPFRELEDFEKSMFGSFFNNNNLDEFKTDLTDEGDHFLLEADLPGFKKEDINLEIRNNQLVISAQRHSKMEQKDNENKVIRAERSYGSYSRQFDVTDIDVNKIGAKYENGVLELKLPKLQKKEPEVRKLNID